MQVGQHVIAVVLAVVGAARAFAGNPAGAPVVAAAAILLWYGAGVVLSRRFDGPVAARWWLVGLTALWAVAVVVVSPEFVWFAFVLWLLSGHLLTRWSSVAFALLVFGVVVVANVDPSGTTTYAALFGPLIGGVFALGVSRGYLELRRDAREREHLVESLTLAQAEMAGLQEELAHTQRHSGAIAERTRLSRDIHDTIAQGLSSIRLLARAELDRDGSGDAGRTLAQVEALAGDNLADVRRIVAELTPSELEDNALAAALARMLERFAAETGIETDLRVDDTLPTLATAHEVALLRTAQSALANARQHAGAGRVVVSLLDGGDSVRLDVVDDGHGFDVGAWTNEPSSPGSSYGLRFMRSRLREQGGGLDIESSPGDGTALSAHLPISTARGS
ncbi:sensor histidine kinase [Tessaracoccus antarcticus]|uniref:Oxygen sensor histidine kinase NreB n=2 Tax=Tessaracoccus antarcticus TaxID=2479848 RepID=A0A3M0G782_9ACTN|nr:sensor histidine kinase [Tessaracoccus antarcticus]